jgi:hypothetical protein
MYYIGILLLLYYSLFRPIIEYDAIVWDPHTIDNAYQIEKMQRRFLRFTSYFLNINCALHDYTPVANQFELPTSVERWRNMGANFLKGLLTGIVDYPILLSFTNFRVPQCISRSLLLFVYHQLLI